MWKKQKTTRRYLQPPRSERLATLWADGSIILGEVVLNSDNTVPDYFTETYSFGICPIYGEEASASDFRKVKSFCFEDGIPVHSLQNNFGELEVTEEAFCDLEKKSSVYVKFKVSNPTEKAVSFGFIVRTGLETDLAFDGPDVYKSYNPDIALWKKLKADWVGDGKEISDGARFIKVLQGDFSFDEKNGILKTKIRPKSAYEFIILMGKETRPRYDFEAQRLKTVEFYKNELKRIKNMPKNADEQMVKSLVIQLLQCFSAPRDKEFLLLRQGGLQRRVWPFEAMYALEALDRIGDFDDYVEPVIDGYFEVMQIETGEIVPLGIYWAMSTAVSLYSFADHALRRGKRFYLKHRNGAIKAFNFIKNTRVCEASDPTVLKGLFPPLQSSDAEVKLQNWTFTDGNNLLGLEKFSQAARHFGDEKYDEISAEAEDYKRVLRYCFDKAAASAKNPDSFLLPVYVPDMPEGSPYPFRVHESVVASVLKLSEEEVKPLIKGLEDDNSRHEGLFNRMCDHYRMKDSDGKVRIWYTTLEEAYWFDVFLRLGKRDICEGIIKSIIDYAMSEEYYMTERYHPLDPYFTPWSPNASASGRLIIMLLRLEENK